MPRRVGEYGDAAKTGAPVTASARVRQVGRAKPVDDRLHFVSPPATLGIGCIAAAVILEEGFTKTGAQASIKVVIVGGAFFLINAVLTHATARATRTREHGEWKPQPGEHIPIVNRPGKYVEVTEEEARDRQKQRRVS